MALAATNVRFFDNLLAFIAECANLNFSYKPEHRPAHLASQFHIRAGVCLQNTWDWAFSAEVRRPVIWRRRAADQPALFLLAASEIVSIEIFTFRPCRRSHG